MILERRPKTLVTCSLLMMASIAAVHALDKSTFKAPAAKDMQAKQTVSGVTIGTAAYDQADLAKPAFGKVSPYEHGVLPVLLVVQNDSKQALNLESIKVEYLTQDRQRVEATPARDVPFLKPPKRPNMSGTPLPGLGRRNKNPLAAPEIDARAFTAKMLPPGDSANGFFYFQTAHRPGSRIYITGLEEAGTRKELFYFDIELEK